MAGTSSPVWTFGGTLPGPLIRVPVGARLIVHFHNNLPEETTIHWHGVRLTADMDGVPEHSQPAVQPGGSFDYSFTVPDSGLFWYHPHVHSAEQVGDGLYGALLVEPRRTGAASDEPAELGDELVLVLSDIGVTADGSLYDPDTGGDLGTLFGREGNVVLVNGRSRPDGRGPHRTSATLADRQRRQDALLPDRARGTSLRAHRRRRRAARRAAKSRTWWC